MKFLNYLNFQINFPQLNEQNTKHLDLGSGTNLRNPFGAEKLVGTDNSHFVMNLEGSSCLEFVDLTKPLPFSDSIFSSISAFDLLEHIPRWERNSKGDVIYPFIQLMSEIHRILRPNGLFTAVTPAYPSSQSFQDPTHINFITESTVNYFVGENSPAKNIGYGFQGEYELLHQSWLRGAGPFEDSKNHLVLGFQNRMQLINNLRFIKRLTKLAFIKGNTHLLWVLKAIK